MFYLPTQSLFVCLLQLVDFLDVIDDPILGYTAPTVITVLHTHLSTCAVDYRYIQKMCENASVRYTFCLFFHPHLPHLQTSVSATASVVHCRVLLSVQ